MAQSRQLAAIMFNDIVGYTSIMEADEQKAFEILGRNRTFQKPIIEEFGGILIKEIGDGIMASFPTVSDALNAAMKIQNECIRQGDFSLRLGIHYGEIMFDNNDIFGDAVNIASRIQTLGVHGAVVFSKKVNDEIANKSNFRSSSLGSFEFKNVKNSIEVFALSNEGFAVPKRSEIGGKRKKKRSPALLLILAGLIIFIVGFVFFNNYKPKSAVAISRDKSIAVLPFVNMSGDPQQEYFSDGLSEELINLFTKLPELRVIGRTSSFAFKGKNEDLRTIGEKLGVEYLLEGSVRKSNNVMRITVQLIRVTDGSHLWSETYDKKTDDIFEVQDEISNSVSDALKVTILNNGSQRKNNVSPDAYNDFLQGLFYYEKTDDPLNSQRAMNWFSEAIKKDSNFSMAWTYTSMCYLRNAWNSNQNDFKEARHAAFKAFELDSTSGIAAANVGEILDNEYNYKEALKYIDLALKLEPENPYVLRNVARFYTLLGRKEASILYAEKALAKDPIQNTAIYYWMCALYYAGHYDDFKRNYNNRLEDFMDMNLYYFMRLLSDGKNEEAKKNINATLSQNYKLAKLTAFNFKIGKKDEAKKTFDELVEADPENLELQTITIAWSGVADISMYYIEKSYKNHERFISYLKVLPFFKNLKDQPRFKKIIAELDFPE
jgi:adenylate cyclase